MKKFLSRYSFIGTVFLFVFFYVVIIFLGNITKKNTKLYQVVPIQLDKSINLDAIIFRDEFLLKANEDGYIIISPNNLEKIAINDILYLIDKNGDFANEFREKFSTKNEMTVSQKENIKNEVENLIINKKNNDLRYIYYLKELINENSTNSIDTTKLINHIKENNINSLGVYKSEISGLFLNSIDGFEGSNIDDIKDSIYIEKKHTPTFTISNTHVSKNTEFAKLITSENWSIVFKIDYEKYQKIKNKKTIGIYFNKTNDLQYGALQVVTIGENYYAKVDFSNNMLRYAQDRFINIAIDDTNTNGYIIPKRALVNISDKQGVYLANNGVAKFCEVKVIDEDSTNYIIDLDTKIQTYDLIIENASKFNDGDRIYK